MQPFKGFQTRLIHAGEPRPRIEGAVILPIFQSAMYETAGETAYGDIRYIRMSNSPNHIALEEKLAALENGEAAVVTASGMAAIAGALLTVLSAGDHLLAQSCLYGGTHDLVVRDLPKLGIAADFIDVEKPESWVAALRPGTRAVYVETISNPLMQVGDLLGIVRFAREHGLTSIIDNTLATPVNFRPLAQGFDLVVHSASKYLNGHSDLVAGAVIGRRGLIRSIRRKLSHLGGCLDPHAAFLLHRGIKTLALRIGYQNRSAQRIAEFLEKHPAVARVYYPGLAASPRYGSAVHLLDGFGGVLSLDLDTDEQGVERVFKSLRLPTIAPSLGGVETLITRPAKTSHAGIRPDERERIGISDRLVRISVGLEDTEDLIEDLDQALGVL